MVWVHLIFWGRSATAAHQTKTQLPIFFHCPAFVKRPFCDRDALHISPGRSRGSREVRPRREPPPAAEGDGLQVCHPPKKSIRNNYPKRGFVFPFLERQPNEKKCDFAV